jgi:hypothetical protein
MSKQEEDNKAKMIELFNQLVALPPIKDAAITYVLQKHAAWNDSNEIKVDVFPNKHPSYYKTLCIYSETHSSSWRRTGKPFTYVRIRSDKYDVYFKGKFTFDNKNLAKRLQKEIAELYFKLIDSHLAIIVKRDNEITSQQILTKKFAALNGSIYADNNTAYLDTGSFKIIYNNYDQKYTINIHKITETQLDKVVNILRNT